MNLFFINLFFLLMFSFTVSAGTPPKIESEQFMIPSLDPGLRLYVRNKHPAGAGKFPSNKILLYVHGATFPAESSFDIALDGLSMMDYIAAHGYDVYLVDLRGYGRSDRPAEMRVAADQNEPIVRTDTAVKDVSAAVDFILKRRHVAKIDLMGWSWGTSIMGWYAAQNPLKVAKLVQYAPAWFYDSPPPNDTKPLGAYRLVTVEGIKARWYTGVPEDKKADLVPHDWIDVVAKAVVSSDPQSATQDPPTMQVPNGVIADNNERWKSGKPIYDPGQILAPTLIVHADWDADLPMYMAREYFAKLTHAPYKRYVEIGEGTHFIMMEKNRMQLFQAVQQFLDEKITVGE